MGKEDLGVEHRRHAREGFGGVLGLHDLFQIAGDVGDDTILLCAAAVFEERVEEGCTVLDSEGLDQRVATEQHK